MNISIQDIELMYDISMRIGLYDDFETELKSCLNIINKKLNCVASIIFFNDNIPQMVKLSAFYSLPKSVATSKKYAELIDECTKLKEENKMRFLVGSKVPIFMLSKYLI